MHRIQGRRSVESATYSRDIDVNKQDSEHEANWKQSVSQEGLLPKLSSELKTLMEEPDSAKTLESVDCTQKNEKSECKYASSLSIVLQQVCEQSGKKKTPMCLVNELARHHKIHPQYRLTEESGPPHQKIFVVNLKLGDEQYTASGQSIKKAQHAAAEFALQKTKFILPEPKSKVKHPVSSKSDKPVTPTVELNALAMKLNFPPVYTNLAPLSIKAMMPEELPLCKGDHLLNQVDQKGKFPSTNFQRPFTYTPQRFPSNSNQRYYFNRHQPTPLRHRVTLAVGQVFVTGEGPSPQSARHHAAQQALEQLRNEIPINKAQPDESPLISEADTDTDLKSPVSLAHELALKLNQTVEFTVLNESGPPHMRNFVVQCKLGEVTTQGEGNCKKIAKRKAAELMLDALKKVHPNGILRPSEGNNISQPRARVKSKSGLARKKPRNLVKDVTSASNGSLGTKPQDPISQLVQLQQARREKEPVFTVLSERGVPRQSPEFVVEVTVGSITATGVGTKKKEAKRAAALKALDALGDTKKLSLVEDEVAVEPLSAVSNASVSTANCAGRQMVPGLLLIGTTPGKKMDLCRNTNTPALAGIQESSQPVIPPKNSGGLRPEIRLRYLAQVLEYELEFSDFPKGKKGDFVSLVTLNTNPPQVSHGLGATLEEAHDNAASNMLKLIAEGALDDMAGPNKENADQRSSENQ
ncbi:double-stranded RNA-binding protein Staufen homolog 2-like isoform X2 [Daphnia carinata]|uniref:double-stranded RNA-binding protein Staufen homolog 2-like isoform X2 n=1 Tax=Daphnia carinata TaxID=120202 RepID=UPI00257BB948|nr:double-stranded RNA-binding protein Staufen homolog 2-like isoform X2 [Daphnia carinata]